MELDDARIPRAPINIELVSVSSVSDISLRLDAGPRTGPKLFRPVAGIVVNASEGFG